MERNEFSKIPDTVKDFYEKDKVKKNNITQINPNTSHTKSKILTSINSPFPNLK